MITITHEGSGPYIERTIIDYGGIRSHADLPAEDTLIDVVSDASGETMQDLRERIEELEEQIKEEGKEHGARIDDKDEEIKRLTADLVDANARLDSADPGSVMRDEIAKLKGLNEGYSATIRRQESELRAALHEAAP